MVNFGPRFARGEAFNFFKNLLFSSPKQFVSFSVQVLIPHGSSLRQFYSIFTSVITIFLTLTKKILAASLLKHIHHN